MAASGSIIFGIICLASAVIAGFGYYLAWMARAAGDSGAAWVFAAFAALFTLLPLAALVAALKPRFPVLARIDALLNRPPKSEPAQRTSGFAPHWMLMLGALVLILVLISIVVAVVRQLLAAF